ncbi:hypothetical protein Ab1vBOLIVR2_gp36 [Agrobacterium phage OLIVR2]|uniref:Uncharacterized protein n=1 Tax=Agrobacterium phage OLIVR1 TaxID=2723769 RepID=A0A858MSE8_9CAUD|nr:hypothetical protein KNU98_gp073 [Agrobacterium phage OLIVR1]QIW87231.1 hypothetical protein Ab1vBOLIVR1_gp36 [Agrobacterium phage OLIVR1]QIW87339.1 hypothetical protein Ab1vBOLIVR2_gp36 [Agrobacterium phage OLIVR2]QIW87446.1 hypothetical protein Ab1vBOLIVR3_gp36 [Agrobacterium phage OLIVR3]
MMLILRQRIHWKAPSTMWFSITFRKFLVRQRTLLLTPSRHSLIILLIWVITRFSPLHLLSR